MYRRVSRRAFPADLAEGIVAESEANARFESMVDLARAGPS
ncbi:hypothetical protein APASM_4584 [Actinosynnema pretiosum subsp. pretiosum]|nr:hypothetical protein APASM_4584 [Actinosynnema pretiosum subsp. pretiosum]